MKNLLVILALASSVTAFACESSICKGDRVNFGSSIGTAIEVFNNGNVKISIDGKFGQTTRNLRTLGKGVKCYKGVCAGNRVNFGKEVGTVAEVFNNGNVKISVDGHFGHMIRYVGNLGVGYRCSANLCKGDRVNFGDSMGTAMEVFNNGNVKINVDGKFGFTFKTVSELGYELQCYN